jgi:hypothetical protein
LPQQIASASRAKARNCELGHKTTHVVTAELRTGSLERSGHLPDRPASRQTEGLASGRMARARS